MTALARRVRFGTEPPVGLVLVIDDQRYEIVGAIDHVRLDGSPTRLAVWRSTCFECGETFECKCPALMLPETRRCREHKMPGRRIDPERKRRIADGGDRAMKEWR